MPVSCHIWIRCPLAAVPQEHPVPGFDGFAYVTNVRSNNVFAFTLEPDGQLQSIEGAPFQAGDEPRSLVIHPTGRFVYVTNSGSDDISTFTINSDPGAFDQRQSKISEKMIDAEHVVRAGRLPVPSRANPAALAVDPQGRFLYAAFAQTDNVRSYPIKIERGSLREADDLWTLATASFNRCGSN